jgi:hypothetical protein
VSGWVDVRDFGARGDYFPAERSGHDDTGALQAALDAAGGAGYHPHQLGAVVYVPRGQYLVTRTLDLTTDMTTFHGSLELRGDGPNRTVFWAGTGDTLFDCTGSLNLTFGDFSVQASHVDHPSSCGFLFARGQKSPWAISYILHRIKADMGSDPSANQGIGTVGIWNHAGEHHTYTDVWLSANLPLVLTRARLPEGLPAAIESKRVEPLQDPYAGSQLMTQLGGNCVLVAYDYHRPCLYLNRVGVVHLDCTYMSLRPSPAGTAPKGDFRFAVEIFEAQQFSHRGMLEGPADYGYLRNHIDLQNADVQVFLARMGDEFADKAPVPLIQLLAAGDYRRYGIVPGIQDSTLHINLSPPGSAPHTPAAVELVPGPFSGQISLRNSRLELPRGAGGTVLAADLEDRLDGSTVIDLTAGQATAP